MQARVRSERQSLSNCANAASTPSINLPVDVSSIGSVAERSEMPSDCSNERSAKARLGNAHGSDCVLHRRFRAAAEVMTPCKRGVSDLRCGRGHDRKRSQISWSLTPRSQSLARSSSW